MATICAYYKEPELAACSDNPDTIDDGAEMTDGDMEGIETGAQSAGFMGCLLPQDIFVQGRGQRQVVEPDQPGQAASLLVGRGLLRLQAARR